MIGSSQVSLPPGSRRTPWGLLRVVHNPTLALSEELRRHGDPFTDFYSGTPIVFSCSPEGARRILTADPDLFEVPAPEQFAPLLGDNSLLFLVGARHRAERKLINPHFHGGRMRAYGNLIRETAAEHFAKLRVSAPFRMQDVTQAISLDVIIKAMFGVGSDRLSEFRAAVLEFVGSFTPPLVFLRFLRRSFAGLSPWDRFIAARARLDRMIDEEVQRRREQAKNGQERHDILSLLIGARYEDGSAMTGLQIRDELVTLLFAGHETSAISLAWALYLLHRTPATLERLRAEVATLGAAADPDALTQLPYLTAVCKETLRLHPVVPILPPRQVREPFEFQGYTVPPGTGISIGTAAMHRRADLYPNPLEFLPERFLQKTYTAFEYMPFGGGTRRCIGSEFALYEMKIVLATLLSQCRLALVSNDEIRERRRSLVMGPENGVPMLLTSRIN